MNAQVVKYQPHNQSMLSGVFVSRPLEGTSSKSAGNVERCTKRCLTVGDANDDGHDRDDDNDPGYKFGCDRFLMGFVFMTIRAIFAGMGMVVIMFMAILSMATKLMVMMMMVMMMMMR